MWHGKSYSRFGSNSFSSAIIVCRSFVFSVSLAAGVEPVDSDLYDHHHHHIHKRVAYQISEAKSNSCES